jgi:glycosyltransferase involved in cell wall biosynthesis
VDWHHVKVLFGCVRYPPAVGGVERHVRTLADGLAARGHCVSIVTSDLLQVGGERLANAEAVDAGFVSRCRSYTAALPGLHRYPLLPAVVPTLLASAADIWHAHAFWFWPGDAMLLMSRYRSRRLIASPYFYTRAHPAWRAYLRIVGSLLARADVVTVLSAHERELLRRSGVEPRRVEVVRPGLDLQEIDATPAPSSDKWQLDGRPVLLFVGRLSQEKGIDTLLHAAPDILRRVPESVFVLAGPDFGERAHLAAYVRTYGLDEQVVFAGELSRQELLGLYKRASVLVLPTRYEAFGIVLIEAMACGIPVLASRVAAVPEVVDDGETGMLFTVDDARDLAVGATALLRDDGLRRQMGAHGRALVEREFTLNRQLTRLEDIYESVL